MQLADAEKLALELMKQFGLLPEWRFEFDDAQRRFGCCHRGFDRKITLSRELTTRNEREQVEDTIRHEIAHALCPPKTGHGEAWKKMCKTTGANPERCYDSDEVDAPKGDWSATCGICGVVHYKFRRPKRELWCSRKECKAMMVPYVPGADRGFHPLRKLVFKHKNALPVPTPSRAAIDAMKAHLRQQEPELRAASYSTLESKPMPTMPTEPELTYQCAKCDRKSISFHVSCPVCGGDMVPESKLRAEKEELKRRIAELEKKAGK